jgi:hypothetical protein
VISILAIADPGPFNIDHNRWTVHCPMTPFGSP